MNEPPSVKVPVPEVTVTAYRTVFGELSLVLELAWLPLLILLAASLVPAALPPGFGAGSALVRGLPDLIDLFVGALCLNAFGARWYQIQLFGAADRPWLGPWSRFLLYTFVLYAALGAVIAVLMLVTLTLGGRGALVEIGVLAFDLAVSLGLMLAIARLSLLYPAAAAGRPIGLRGAWRATRGNGWRIVLCWLFATAPLLLAVQMLMAGVLAGFDIGDARPAPLGLVILRAVVGIVTDFLIAALGAVALSAIYRRLVRPIET